MISGESQVNHTEPFYFFFFPGSIWGWRPVVSSTHLCKNDIFGGLNPNEFKYRPGSCKKHLFLTEHQSKIVWCLVSVSVFWTGVFFWSRQPLAGGQKQQAAVLRGPGPVVHLHIDLPSSGELIRSCLSKRAFSSVSSLIRPVILRFCSSLATLWL